MFESRPPCDRHGSAIDGDEYDGALMSFGVYAQPFWKTSKPSASSDPPVSRGSLPATTSRVSVQAPTTRPGTAET